MFFQHKLWKSWSSVFSSFRVTKVGIKAEAAAEITEDERTIHSREQHCVELTHSELDWFAGEM